MALIVPASVAYEQVSVETAEKLIDGLSKILLPLAGLLQGLKPVVILVAKIYGTLIGGLTQSYVFLPPLKLLPTQTLQDLYVSSMLALFPFFYVVKICIALGPLGLLLFPILLPVSLLLTVVTEILILPLGLILGAVTDLVVLLSLFL